MPADSPTCCKFTHGKGRQNKVLRLRRALYSLRKSALLAYKTASNFLVQSGFSCCYDEQCLFRRSNMTLLPYVDGLLIISPDSSSVSSFKTDSLKRTEARDIGPVDTFLGIQIIRNRQHRSIHLLQATYIDESTARFHLNHAPSLQTSLPRGNLPLHHGSAAPESMHLYQ